MRINAKVTILCGDNGVTIEVQDDDANTNFLKLTLSPEQWCTALGRLAFVSCEECEVAGLDHVGLVHESKSWTFSLPEDTDAYDKNRESMARHEADMKCPVGWKPDTCYKSRDSFFQKDGKFWARTRIRRWVAKAIDAEIEKEGDDNE